MILCFECNGETKQQMEQLVATGRYTNFSEVIAVAVANQVLLHAHATRTGDFVIRDSADGKATDDGRQIASGQTGSTTQRVSPDVSTRLDLSRSGVPDVIKTRPSRQAGLIADPPDDLETEGTVPLPASRWIFGQYNKMLPVKASCRALANLLGNSRGVELAFAAKRIANEAAELGNHLRMLDQRHRRSREEILSTAFPGNADPDKGRIRYANQFVAAVDRQGQLSGLLYDLKLINKVSGRNTHISLTQAGWSFALMDNPTLDDASSGEEPTEKFAEEERSFMLGHIALSVPRERSAYGALLGAIAGGHDTPEKVTEVLSALEAAQQQNLSFIATQRSGAISRMSDLSLLLRDRDGIRVKYIATEEGKKFLKGKFAGKHVP